jgi:hypothetical protein
MSSLSSILRSNLPRSLVHRLALRSTQGLPSGALKLVTTNHLKQPDMQQQKLSMFRAVVRFIISLYLFYLMLKKNISLAVLKGTVNDPTTFPPSSRSHGSHHWAFERLLSASLVPLTAAAFVTSGSNYPVLDGLFAVGLVMHSHVGVCFFFFSLKF